MVAHNEEDLLRAAVYDVLSSIQSINNTTVELNKNNFYMPEDSIQNYVTQNP